VERMYSFHFDQVEVSRLTSRTEDGSAAILVAVRTVKSPLVE
jgi:hypothetical protein